MASDVAPIERLEERPIGVDPRAIEDEFGRIWRDTVGEESPIRVRVLNLVAIATTAEEMDRFETAMQLLPERHPCRGILIAAAPAYARIEATISAHCWRSAGGRRHVCSEEVILTGAPGLDREMASAVLALLVPELPVSVWLLGAPSAAGSLRDRILGDADRLLLDTAREARAVEGLACALRLIDTHGVTCGDLAWERSAAWRGLVAQLFDGADGARELELLRSIEIHGGAGQTSSDALLLAGWLITRLGLAPADVTVVDSTVTATMYDGTREVRIVVAPADDGAKLSSLSVATTDASFRIERHNESGHLHVREDWDAGSMRRVVEAPLDDDASLVAIALDGAHGASLYEQAGRAAVSLFRSA